MVDISLFHTPIFYSITVLNLWVTVTVRVLLVIERLGLGLRAPSKGKAPFKLYKIVGSNAVNYNIISNNVSSCNIKGEKSLNSY